MSAAKLAHEQWVNVMSMLLGKTPEEVEAAYQRVKREHPETAADLTARIMKVDPAPKPRPLTAAEVDIIRQRHEKVEAEGSTDLQCTYSHRDRGQLLAEVEVPT